MSGVQCEFDSQSISCFIRRLELSEIICSIIIIIIIYCEYSVRYTLEMMVATTCDREHKPPHYTTPEDRLNDQRRNKTQAC